MVQITQNNPGRTHKNTKTTLRSTTKDIKEGAKITITAVITEGIAMTTGAEAGETHIIQGTLGIPQIQPNKEMPHVTTVDTLAISKESVES